MAKQGVAWNKDRTKSVVLSKLKEFTINENFSTPEKSWTVRGWFNQENYFYFGDFPTKQEAEDFLENIHRMF